MTVDASRITYIRHVGRHLFRGALAGLAVPFMVAGPAAFLVTVLVWALGSFSAAWRTGLVLAALGLILGLVIVGWFVYQQLGETRWIEVWPPGAATRVGFTKVRGTDAVAVADLRSVHVVETIELGRSIGCEVWFTTSDRRFRFPKIEPLRVPAAKLDGWFTERLGPAGVEVTSETVINRLNMTIEHWYTRSQVAAIWGIPVQSVDRLAALLEVPNQSFTPRFGAMRGVDLTVQAFNPDDVHLVAAKVPAAHAKPPRMP
ncbi:hypothetical protein [Actinoplanes sp. NBRC 103695]|uniref:hypothetical protein n=1 Tax=Actinoplanes sp. NBRC 103695 TaxID=3032202 RepID=UPI0024A20E88|nr:hypothetical protein [Actinoplanes sp. NBRC 103695]GLZ00269.1 hypothetical protein Acsp02_75210 [Actinoplanes sp. NBRC 103695]